MLIAESSASTSEQSGPDWERVPFFVGCARCGQDLRGLVEPRCPACALEFEWADAVPVEELTCAVCGYHLYGLQESRCPECGVGFTWDEALDRYRRQKVDLFEYQWRRRPIRSFFRTWRKALFPTSFWKSVDIHDPPRVGPLLVFASVILLGSCVVVSIAFGVSYSLPLWSFGGDFWGIVHRTAVIAVGFFLPLLGVAGPYAGFSFCALLVLRQSMARCRIRTPHALRACTYSLLQLFPIVTPLICAVIIGTQLLYQLGKLEWVEKESIMDFTRLVVAILIPAFSLWSIRCAYRYYIRMPHSAGVAACSQIIAVLGTLVVWSLPLLIYWYGP